MKDSRGKKPEPIKENSFLESAEKVVQAKDKPGDGIDLNYVEKSALIREVEQLQGRIVELQELSFEKDNLIQKNLLLGSVVEFLNEAIIGLTVNGIIMSWNKGAEKIFGYTSREAIGRNTSILAPPDRQHEVWNIHKKVISGQRIDHFETVHLRKDGTTFPIVLSAAPILNDKGAVIGMSVIGRDITEQKQIEIALRQNQEKYRQLFDLESDAIFLIDDETGRILEVNASASALYGYSREEFLEKTNIDMSAEPQQTWEATQNVQNVVRIRHHRKKDGTVFPVEITVAHVMWNGRKSHLAAIRDITDRRMAEEVLLKSEEDYRNIYENAMVGIFQSTPEGKYLKVNSALAAIHGFSSPEEMVRTVTNIGEQLYAHPEDRIRYMELLKKTDMIRSFEARLHRKDKSTVWISMNVRVVRRPDGAVAYYEGIVEDITSRRLAEEELKLTLEKLRQSEETLSAAINANNESLVLIDRQGTVLLSNTMGAQRLGKDVQELVGTCLYDHFPSDVAASRKDHFHKVFTTGKSIHFEDIREGKFFEQHCYPVHGAEGETLQVAVFAKDITERKQTEEFVRNSEKSLRHIIEHNADGMVVVSADGIIRFVNPATASLFARSEAELLGSCFGFPMTGGEQTELDIIRPPGYGTVVVEMIVVEIEWQGERSYLASLRDITSLKLHEKELKASAQKLRKSLASTIDVISMMLQIRDPYTGGHQKKVSSLARSMAQEMDLDKDILDSIRMAASIHDIGKMSIPAGILCKPTRLSEVEMNLIKVHPRTGFEILIVAELPPPIAEIVLQHHERLDGSGYPQGLKDGQILLEAQILAVADVVEAMASHRPYRPAVGIGAALEEIERNKGVLYQPEVVDACVKLFREKGFTFKSTE